MTSRLCERLELDQPVIQAPWPAGHHGGAGGRIVAGGRAGLAGRRLPERRPDRASRRRDPRAHRPSLRHQPVRVRAGPALSGRRRAPAGADGAVSEQLGLDAPAMPGPQADPLATQIEAVLRARPAVFSFTFGRIAPEVLAQCRELGILTVGTATTVRKRWRWNRMAWTPWWPRAMRPAAIAALSWTILTSRLSARWRWCLRWSMRSRCR